MHCNPVACSGALVAAALLLSGCQISVPGSGVAAPADAVPPTAGGEIAGDHH